MRRERPNRHGAAILLAVLAGVAPVYGDGARDAEWDWGPFASRLRDVHGTTRLRAVGPLVEYARDDEGRYLLAIRPLAAGAGDAETGWTRREALWPLLAGKKLREEATWRFALVWYQDFDVNDPAARWRLWVLPVYFQGRDAAGRPYVAIFPLGGRLREFLMLDQVDFALWPLWVRSRQNEVRSTTVLWPIFSRTRGKGIYRIRVFPFYGRSAMRDHYVKKFILWPIYTEAEYRYPDSQGFGFLLVPFYGRIRLTDQRADLVIPPFFRYGRGERQSQVHAPWPFVQIGWGEIQRFYLWPLYGADRRYGVETGFALWPIFWRERTERAQTVFHRWAALPLLQVESETPRRPREGALEPSKRYVRLWPLASYERIGAERRWRAPVLMPFRDPPPVDRNWTPLWTLFERTAVGDRADTEILWGVFRRQYRGAEGCRTSIFPLVEWSVRRDPTGAAPPTRSWSMLKGLIGYERSGEQRALRVLYWIRIPSRSYSTEP